MSEALSHELAPFGIRVLIVEPGGFNTQFASSIILPSKPLTTDYIGTPVDKVLSALPSLIGNQFGDPNKACQAIFDVVSGSGLAKHLGEQYLRLPLGSDCAARLQGKFDLLQKTLDGTKVIWASTDVATEDGKERKMLNFN
jgi:hypothetical protein